MDKAISDYKKTIPVIKEGIVFNGFDSREHGMYLINRSAPTPEEKEILEELAFTQGQRDFSHVLGERFFNDREIEYEFHVYGQVSYEERKAIQIYLENKLMKLPKRDYLFDSHDPTFRYYGKITGIDTQDDARDKSLKIIITFKGYPFKIDYYQADDDLWDSFHFPTGVVNKTEYTARSDWSKFKRLEVGDYATYGAWATTYYNPESSTGNGAKINAGLLGQTYKITETVDMPEKSRSKRAYKFKGLGDQWLLEQDVLQAQTQWTDAVLINAGSSSIAPSIKVTNKVTIIVNDKDIFNITEPGEYIFDEFRLSTENDGINNLRIYAHQPAEIKFNWRKELI